jgi:hypothetical protein
MSNIDNSQDIIDSRDIIERIEELQAERDAFETEGVDGGAALRAAAALWEEQNPDEAEELATLEALADRLDGCADWVYGATLVRKSHFHDYAQALAEDLGLVKAGAHWPNNCIDWEEAANQLEADYDEADYDGVAYMVRA